MIGIGQSHLFTRIFTPITATPNFKCYSSLLWLACGLQ